jgi:hypothetical protein
VLVWYPFEGSFRACYLILCHRYHIQILHCEQWNWSWNTHSWRICRIRRFTSCTSLFYTFSLLKMIDLHIKKTKNKTFYGHKWIDMSSIVTHGNLSKNDLICILIHDSPFHILSFDVKLLDKFIDDIPWGVDCSLKT